MPRRLLLALAILQGALFAVPALACDCISDSVDPQKYLHDASLVFDGEVLDRPLTSLVRDTVTLRVLSSMKGRLRDEVSLDQSRAGDCAAVFPAGARLRIVAYGSAEEGYWTSACTLGYLSPELQGDEIWALATSNRERTLSLRGSDPAALDAAGLRRLIQWHAEYGSAEEGLDAVDRLLLMAPGDAEALRFKAQFLAALKDQPIPFGGN